MNMQSQIEKLQSSHVPQVHMMPTLFVQPRFSFALSALLYLLQRCVSISVFYSIFFLHYVFTIGCDGMGRIVKGALAHRDTSQLLAALPIPLVLLQSTDDALINAANVDAFLKGRVARHTWSHQLHLGTKHTV